MRHHLVFILLLFFSYQVANAQFATDRNLHGRNTGEQQKGDSLAPAVNNISLKKYFSSLAHKDTMSVIYSWGGSLLLPGSAQIYNRDYWKLPIIYGSIGGMIYGGWSYNEKYKKSGLVSDANNRDLFYLGAALCYWGSVLDGIVSYKSELSHDPGKATLYSAMLPGLGQAYNGDYWKIPIFYGVLVGCGYAWTYNGTQYKRYKDLYNQATTPGSDYEGSMSADNLKYYRDSFRRFRDYSILATVAGYVLQIVDANVFAIMSDFDVSDDLSLNISPSIISPIISPNNNNYTNYALAPNTSLGVKLNLTF